MLFLFLFLFTAFVLQWPASGADPSADRPKSRQKGSPKSEAGTSMSGCIDERDGGYLLVNDRDMTPIVNLEAEGFPVEGFAKYLGRKVTVRGQQSTTNGRSVFRVRTVSVVSDTCAPSPPPK